MIYYPDIQLYVYCTKLFFFFHFISFYFISFHFISLYFILFHFAFGLDNQKFNTVWLFLNLYYHELVFGVVYI